MPFLQLQYKQVQQRPLSHPPTNSGVRRRNLIVSQEPSDGATKQIHMASALYDRIS